MFSQFFEPEDPVPPWRLESTETRVERDRLTDLDTGAADLFRRAHIASLRSFSFKFGTENGIEMFLGQKAKFRPSLLLTKLATKSPTNRAEFGGRWHRRQWIALERTRETKFRPAKRNFGAGIPLDGRTHALHFRGRSSQ
jgi:hypothetical protein